MFVIVNTINPNLIKAIQKTNSMREQNHPVTNNYSEFELRSYSRKELAQLYFPDSSHKSATQNLRRWLNIHTSHQVFLDSISRKQLFRRAEVEMIIELIGEP